MAKYYSTKTYDIGLSACFRQWRATRSMCHFLHGYALTVKFTFGCHSLDEKNWCQDFGDLKEVKAFLQEKFDHKTCVAIDDPLMDEFVRLNEKGLIQLVVLPSVGCEKFAEYIFTQVDPIIQGKSNGRVWVESVEVMEHGANSAIYSK
jgi:6-pyruvoyltetrahydropterin/6-carboxytetrahydropterin synthase